MLRCIVGLLLLAGLAGCSARSGSPAATGTAGSPDVAAIVGEWVQCVRANGAQNLPDPQIDSDGRPPLPRWHPGAAGPGVAGLPADRRPAAALGAGGRRADAVAG